IGEKFEPQEITKRLLIKPNEYYMKGDKSVRDFERKECCWSINTGYIDTLYVSEVIDKLIYKLSNKVDIIVDLKKEYDLICKFFIVINIVDDEKPAIYLDKNIIEFANTIEAEFDFDMYIYYND
ncbi:MAG: DUF4279 domain-containing protein, partial [Clostridium sp.]